MDLIGSGKGMLPDGIKSALLEAKLTYSQLDHQKFVFRRKKSFKKMHLKMKAAKWLPFFLDRNVLNSHILNNLYQWQY